MVEFPVACSGNFDRNFLSLRPRSCPRHDHHSGFSRCAPRRDLAPLRGGVELPPDRQVIDKIRRGTNGSRAV